MASATTSSDRDLLAECWAADASIRDDGPSLYPILESCRSLSRLVAGDAVEPLHEGAESTPGTDVDPLREALRCLIGVLHAERAFLVQAVPGPTKGEWKAGEPLAACDLEGEPVLQPERKVPLTVLGQVAGTRLPLSGNAADVEPSGEGGATAPAQPSHWIAFPVLVRGECGAVAHVENRFQPLELSRESLQLACAQVRILGGMISICQLRSENEALWTDLTRLRESRCEAPQSAVSPTVARERRRHPKRSDLHGDYSAITGSGPRMLEIFRIIDRISTSNAPVLINGESGTGKELIANAVHQNSPRKGKVFVSENCGALTESLLESELFGYVKGAFTGAHKDHKGLFELAEGGTLFLDEVGDMSPGMQKKLLRVLQEGVIRRVGGKDYIPVDVRIISATNKDLMNEVQAGNFREDLYYRLNVINLRLPPLRERREDIPELVEQFLAELEQETGTRKKVEPEAMQRLERYTWPGNVRELRNEIKRVCALSDGDIRVQDLSDTLLAGENRDVPFQLLERDLSHLTLRDAMERLEKEMIRSAIHQARGNKSKVAEMLQVPKTSLYNKINKYGLDKI